MNNQLPQKDKFIAKIQTNSPACETFSPNVLAKTAQKWPEGTGRHIQDFDPRGLSFEYRGFEGQMMKLRPSGTSE